MACTSVHTLRLDAGVRNIYRWLIPHIPLCRGCRNQKRQVGRILFFFGDVRCLVLRFLTYDLPALLYAPGSYCSEIRGFAELAYFLERCTDRCIKTIPLYPVAYPAYSFVPLLPRWKALESPTTAGAM